MIDLLAQEHIADIEEDVARYRALRIRAAEQWIGDYINRIPKIQRKQELREKQMRMGVKWQALRLFYNVEIIQKYSHCYIEAAPETAPRAEGWLSFNMEYEYYPEALDYFLRVVGEGEYKIIITHKWRGPDGSYGENRQFLISPQGMAHVKDKQRRESMAPPWRVEKNVCPGAGAAHAQQSEKTKDLLESSEERRRERVRTLLQDKAVGALIEWNECRRPTAVKSKQEPAK